MQTSLRMVKVLVSACLVGSPCRYNGTDEKRPDLLAALEREGVEAIAFCPEEAGGLGTPRPAAQIDGGDGAAVVDGTARVVTSEGRDVTEAFLDGARQAVGLAREEECRVAYLKACSPSCACAMVHTKEGLVPGCGVTNALLKRAGIATISVA